MQVVTAGDLQQIILGGWVRDKGSDRNGNYIGATNTSIDDLAVFDYPATEEQIKWLCKFDPAQPKDGPGREMPVCWHFNTLGNRGLVCEESGTGGGSPYKFRGNTGSGANNDYANYADGALGSQYCFWLRQNTGSSNNPTRYWAAFRTDGTGERGLGATVASGFAFSFWLKAGNDIADWMSFFGWTIGSQTGRLAWDNAKPAGINGYQDSNTTIATIPSGKRIVDEWQHVCLDWNQAEEKIDIYIDGEAVAQVTHATVPAPGDAVNMLMFGPRVPGTNVKYDYYNTGDLVYVDEFAFFNHSLSPEQVAWLAENPPALPPLGQETLVRTVAANCAWSGRLASWGVEGTSRTTIWPSCEDLGVSAEVAFADGVEMTNDTFVTCGKLTLASASGAAAATLRSEEGSMFAPQSLEIGEGLQLTVAAGAASTGGTLVLGAGSKIVFDMSSYSGSDVALATGGIELPEGESDALAHFAATDGRFTLSLSDDGKTVYARLDTLAATALWTGAADGTSLGDGGNWECRNSAGELLPSGTLPCELTRVIVSSGANALDAPAGTSIPWQYLRFEAHDATLQKDCDWRCLGAVLLPEGTTLDLNGNKLFARGFEGAGTFAGAGATAGELHFDIPAGATFTNATFTVKGALRLVKDGEGTFVAAKSDQRYAGGTEVAGGTFELAKSDRPLGPVNSEVKVCSGAKLDMTDCVNASTCVYNYDLAGTLRAKTAKAENGWAASCKILGTAFTLSGNARIEGGAFYFGSATIPLYVTMNGFTLTFANDDYIGVGAFRSYDYGKFVFRGEGVAEWLNAYGPQNVDVETFAPGVLKQNGDYDVGGFRYEGEKWMKNAKASHVLVYGRYVAGAIRPPLYMQDGSTLDLGEIKGTLDLTGAVAGSGTTALTSTAGGEIIFRAGSAESPTVVTVDLGDRTDIAALSRTKVNGEYAGYLVKWSSKPADTVKFVQAKGRNANYKFAVDDTGLLVLPPNGFCVFLR